MFAQKVLDLLVRIEESQGLIDWWVKRKPEKRQKYIDNFTVDKIGLLFLTVVVSFPFYCYARSAFIDKDVVIFSLYTSSYMMYLKGAGLVLSEIINRKRKVTNFLDFAPIVLTLLLAFVVAILKGFAMISDEGSTFVAVVGALFIAFIALGVVIVKAQIENILQTSKT